MLLVWRMDFMRPLGAVDSAWFHGALLILNPNNQCVITQNQLFQMFQHFLLKFATRVVNDAVMVQIINMHQDDVFFIMSSHFIRKKTADQLHTGELSLT